MAASGLEVFLNAPIRRTEPPELYREAWSISDELGWARTYDAEYVALARLLACPLLSLDGPLRRGAARAVQIMAPEEL